MFMLMAITACRQISITKRKYEIVGLMVNRLSNRRIMKAAFRVSIIKLLTFG